MRFFEFKPTAEQLNELYMGHNTLVKQASSPTLGALAGMEFEMIVPVEDIDDADSEYEPDFDYDERITNYDSFQDIIYFFGGGEGFNDRHSLQQFENQLITLYFDWLD